MEPLPTGSGRSTRLALVAVGLLALLAVVAFASRSGLGHQSQAKPSPGYVSYAFTAFLIVFVLAIPLAMYTLFLQAREGTSQRPSFTSRMLSSIGFAVMFGVLAFVLLQLKKHHSGIFDINAKSLHNAHKQLKDRNGKLVPYGPKFEWNVLWVALVAFLGSAAFAVYKWRTRKLRTAIPLELQPTVAEDLAQSIGDAIGDLEAEPDARRAVIAAYARMEAVLARHGLRRRPSETPVEYLRRILLGLTARVDAVQRLTELFEEAKFSRHDITASMKQEAIDALGAIRGDLQREAA